MERAARFATERFTAGALLLSLSVRVSLEISLFSNRRRRCGSGFQRRHLLPFLHQVHDCGNERQQSSRFLPVAPFTIELSYLAIQSVP